MNDSTIYLEKFSSATGLEALEFPNDVAERIKECVTFLVVGGSGSVIQSEIRAMLLRQKPDANIVFVDEVPKLHKADVLGSLSEGFACSLRDIPKMREFGETTVQEQAGYAANSFQSMNPNLQKLNPRGKSIIGGSNKRRKGKRK